ncbi:neuroligin-2-like isoform X2 [Macrosteles quadrilineatus]|uniref:neuroligin-2-like isoform X2 n=1 Tax=Macrosteles quadrilineatus TaxID=74068 RepID=UPI0023E1661E|nr:neuroligin-2-like isoform X2 [Macrosteles quadrilineatus]
MDQLTLRYTELLTSQAEGSRGTEEGGSKHGDERNYRDGNAQYSMCCKSCTNPEMQRIFAGETVCTGNSRKFSCSGILTTQTERKPQNELFYEHFKAENPKTEERKGFDDTKYELLCDVFVIRRHKCHTRTHGWWRTVLCAVILAQLCLLTSCRTVRTKYGDVSGVIVTPDNRYLDAVEVFKGIPYATPPVGSLRFMPPVSGAMWQGVKMANRFSPVCPQSLPDVTNDTAALRKMSRGRLEYLRRMIPYLRNQSEDCLYLNVYVPHVVLGDPREPVPLFPVLVYIHGDSYMWGAGSLYDGSVLSSYGGLVVVTLNYRLGILGFLNTNSGPSNFGLMDQIAALHWVQENIASFGGDPRNVTVMGHGTGAVCVHLLATTTAVTEGSLFQRVILMSGSALCPWALVRDPLKFARQVSRHAACPWDRQLMTCLRQRPLEVLTSVPADHPQFITAFGPSVDGVVVGGRLGDEGEDLPPAPHHILGLLRRPLVARLSRYPLLLGTVRLESYFAFTADDVQYGVEPDRKARLMRTFVKNTYRYHQSEILATVMNEYTDWERPVQHPINIRDETMDALSDAMVVAPIVQTADLHSSSRSSAFMYVFDYQTRLGDYPQKQGCVHGEELPYVFGAPLVSSMMHFPRNFTKTEVQLAEMTMDYWTNFIKTGSPNTGHDTEVPRLERQRGKMLEWQTYDKVHKRYLNLDMKPKMKNHYRAHRLSFWLNLVPDLHRPGGDVPHSHHQLDPDERPRLVDKVVTPPPSRPPPAPSDPDVPLSPPPVVVASSASKGSTQGHRPSHFTAPTALRATVAVGGILLVLNIIVFLVFYRRGRGVKYKRRSSSSASGDKMENGGPMSTICVTSGATDLSSVETRLTFTPVLSDSLTDLRSFTLPAPEAFQGPLTPESPEIFLEPPEVPEIPDVAPPLPPKTSKTKTPGANETLPLLSDGLITDLGQGQGQGREEILRV